MYWCGQPESTDSLANSFSAHTGTFDLRILVRLFQKRIKAMPYIPDKPRPSFTPRMRPAAHDTERHVRAAFGLFCTIDCSSILARRPWTTSFASEYLSTTGTAQTVQCLLRSWLVASIDLPSPWRIQRPGCSYCIHVLSLRAGKTYLILGDTMFKCKPKKS
jgi:hypothetical protein